MSTRIFPIPMGVGPDPETYYTKAEVDALIAEFITNTVDDLTNYYLKSETYTQTEVNNLISGISQFHYEVYPTLASVTDPQTNVLYLIGPDSSATGDLYEEYVYDGNDFVKIGDTSIDLSGYVTTTDLNTALAAKQNLIDSEHKLDYSLIANAPEEIKEWFGSMAEFMAIPNKDVDTNYYISDPIKYSEIKNTPDLTVYDTITDVDSKVAAVDEKVALKTEVKFMSASEYAQITPKEGETYAIQGETVELVFTLADDSSVAYNFVID